MANLHAAALPLTLPLPACIDPTQVGGKAINLARLINAGFNVPDGFVVTTAGFRACREVGRVSDDLAAQIAERYQAMGAPPVAVRSSATAEDLAEASMAGQYETYLNVEGEQGVVEAVQQCWASLDTDRTRSYLAEHGIALEQVTMAVVVQRQVPADAAGVLFTANPRTGDEQQMLIEANWGLGDTVVSGVAQPDTLTIDWEDGQVVESHIADKRVMLRPGGASAESVTDDDRDRPCLSSPDVDALWRLGQRIHEHFGRAQDVEWAKVGEELFVLQSRAITTLEEMAALRRVEAEARRQAREALEEGRGPWVPHNLAETLPAPTPLTWSIMKRFLGSGGLGTMYREAGFEPGPAVSDEPFVDLIGGRISMDLSRAAEMFFADFPFEYDPDQLREDPDAGQSPPTIPTGGVRQRLRIGRKLAAVRKTVDRLADQFDQRLESELIPQFMQWVEAEREADLTALDAEQLMATLRAREEKVMSRFAPMSLLPTLIIAQVMAELNALLRENLFEQDTKGLAQRLAAGGQPDLTVQANHGLYQVAQEQMTLDRWLAEHGHRAPEEFDLATPRWRERPEDARRLAEALREGADPLEKHHELATRTEELVAETRASLPGHAQKTFDRHIALLHRYMRFREDAKHYLMHGYELLRQTTLEAGRRLAIGEDVFYLTDEELASALEQGYVSLDRINRRKAEHRAARNLVMPHLIDEHTVDQIGRAAPVLGGDRLDAFSLSAGVGCGPVRIVDRPEEGRDLGTGYVLVCRSTDPSWTPLFVNAAGLVLESGGSLSHGAVVAREMGVPAVVLPNARTRLTDGQTVTVDGNHGAVIPGEAAADQAEREGVASPEDTRIAEDRLPPPPGRIERIGARVRNVALVLWAVYFVLAFLPYISPLWVYRPTMQVLDALLWPLVPAFGPVGAVAVISVGLAIGIMVLQRLATDHRRLVAAKRRANALKREAKRFPPDSPRHAALLAGTGGVQGRMIAAAFLPLAILLGPLIMILLWLPVRVAPGMFNPEPGATINVQAAVDSDYDQPVAIELGEGLSLPGGQQVTQRTQPIRQVLTEYQSRLQQERAQLAAPTIAEQLALDAALVRELRSLDDFLKNIPDQTLSWAVATPEGEPGIYPVSIQTPDHPPMAMHIVVGEDLPPDPGMAGAIGRPGGVATTTVVYPGRQPYELIFFQPFAFAGWGWDIGWLGVYIITYVPAMFAAKWALRVP
jgi:pyruvate,water dikinase